MIDLGTLSGDTVSEALALNEHNQVVGSSSRTGFRSCVLWDNGTITALGNTI
jgi:uncharacterized membrane protein